jgi:hypothetical protein
MIRWFGRQLCVAFDAAHAALSECGEDRLDGHIDDWVAGT